LLLLLSGLQQYMLLHGTTNFVLNDVDCMPEGNQYNGFDDAFTGCIGADYDRFVLDTGVNKRRDVAFVAAIACLLTRRAGSLLNEEQQAALDRLYKKAFDSHQHLTLDGLVNGFVDLVRIY
jgi:hypothetical protein